MSELDEDAPTIDAAHYRRVLGHFATGVTVITAMDGDEPTGMAANSFTSVSIDPPLVLFCAAKSSTTWPRIQAAGHFCVNVLADDQEEICRLFATKGADRFKGVGWRAGKSGAPVLQDSLAWIDCVAEAEHEAGDHLIVVGRCLEMESREGEPLLFYRGGYRNLD
jgi:3-hydroxy-9,10-secoandrosta-1,3,5(10)-triene-9,17-dione monooxygenase reductase component